MPHVADHERWIGADRMGAEARCQRQRLVRQRAGRAVSAAVGDKRLHLAAVQQEDHGGSFQLLLQDRHRAL